MGEETNKITTAGEKQGRGQKASFIIDDLPSGK